MYQLHGGCTILNWDVSAVIHTTCVCFSLSILLQIKRTQMPTTQHNTKCRHLALAGHVSYKQGWARSSEDNTKSRNQPCSKYVYQAGYSYKLVKTLRRPEPVTVQNFVTSFLYLRACCTRRFSRVYDMIYDIWYDMIWYDMIWYDMIYDMIWYDMIWYDICQLQLGWHPVAAVQDTFINKQYIEQHKYKQYIEQHK